MGGGQSTTKAPNVYNSSIKCNLNCSTVCNSGQSNFTRLFAVNAASKKPEDYESYIKNIKLDVSNLGKF